MTRLNDDFVVNQMVRSGSTLPTICERKFGGSYSRRSFSKTQCCGDRTCALERNHVITSWIADKLGSIFPDHNAGTATIHVHGETSTLLNHEVREFNQRSVFSS